VGLINPTWDDLRLIEVLSTFASRPDKAFELLLGTYCNYCISTMGKKEQAQYSHLNEDEEQSTQYEHDLLLHRELRRRRFSRSPFFYILDTILALAVIFLLFRRDWYEKVQRFDLGSDITGYAPQIDHSLVTFTKQPYFISNHTSLESLREAREHWKTLVPREFASFTVYFWDKIANGQTSWPRLR